jgi:3',5'-cyclic AMP phosphodiesterase CpdA
VLGNHDDPREVIYPLFNMDGERYYSFSPPEDLLTKLATRVEFFALDSTNLDRTQLRWLDERLAKSKASWKVCFFHHPLYTSGRYRMASSVFRALLEPLLVSHGVDAVFSGHEHIYQRSELQSGIQYFISGGAGIATARRRRAGVLCRADLQRRLPLHADRDRWRRAALFRRSLVAANRRCGHAVSGCQRGPTGDRRYASGARRSVADRADPLLEQREPTPTPASRP